MQGGLYAPSIFVGAALGSAFGQLAHVVGDPAGLLLSAPQAYALVGELTMRTPLAGSALVVTVCCAVRMADSRRVKSG